MTFQRKENLIYLYLIITYHLKLIIKYIIYFNHIRMFLQIFFTAFVIVSLLFWYYFYLLPQRNIKRYINEFQRLGYKPYVIEFHPFQLSTFEMFNRGGKKGDLFHYYKFDLQGYDLIIGNNINSVMLQLLSPELIKQFCEQERLYNFQKDQSAMMIFDRISGKGLVSSERDIWKKKRKCLNKVFNFNFISKQTDTIRKCVKQSFDEVNQNIKQDGTLKFSIKQFSISFTSKFVFNGFLGGNLNAQKINDESPTNLLKTIIDQGMKYFDDMIAMTLSQKFISKNLRQKDRINNRMIKTFNNWANSYIENRMKQEQQRMKVQQDKYQPNDIISALVYEDFVNKTKEYNIQELTSQFKTFFIAGIETTSSFFMSMIYFVYSNPIVLEKLKTEINETMKSDEIVFDQIKNMKYIQAIQNQTIRIMGPGNSILTRTAFQDHYLGGAKIYKGTSVQYYSHVAHFSQRYYKQPLQWRPERWLNGQCKNNHSFALIGFHGGPRACIGKHIALLESKIALIMFIKQHKSVKIDCTKLQAEFGLVFWPKDYKVQVQI